MAVLKIYTFLKEGAMANVYYNEKTGLPEFKIGPLSLCLTGLVLFMSVMILLTWVAVSVILFLANSLFCPNGVDKKVIIRK